MRHWAGKFGRAILLAALVLSGLLQAFGHGIFSANRSLAALPWSTNSRELQRRYAAVVPPPWSSTDTVISSMQARLRASSRDQRAYVILGEGYLQKARETGDPTYYTKADAVLQRARRPQPNDAETIAAQGSLALSRHQFSAALQLGQQAHALDPYRANVLGLISDADVQLGRDAEAEQAAQEEVDLRPDLSSYARISYLRELRGDLAGAVAAMQEAAVAGGPAPENVAWTAWQLGTL